MVSVNTDPNYQYRVLAQLDTLEQTNANLVDCFTGTVEQEHTTLKRLKAEHAALREKSLQQTDQRESWSTFVKGSTCTLSALTTIAGASIVTTAGGGLVGAALMASGLLSLSNFVLSETGAWNWVAEQIAPDDKEKQQQLLSYMPMAVGAVALIASVSAGGAGTLLAPLGDVNKLLLIGQTAAQLATSAGQIGKGATEYRLAQTQAEFNDINTEITALQERLESGSSELNSFFDQLKTAEDAVAEMIQISKRNYSTFRG